MNNKNKILSITNDLTMTLSFSHLWFIGIILIINVILFVFSLIQGGSFSTFSYSTASIYMLIMGFIAAYHYFPMYVQLGITRKNSFLGNMYGAILGALVLVIFLLLISGLEHFLVQVFNFSAEAGLTSFESLFGFAEGSERQINHFLFENTIFASLSRIILTAATFWGTILLTYSIGWMIGTSFYKPGIVGKISTIITGITFALILDVFWGEDGLVSFLPELATEGLLFTRWAIGISGTLLMIGISLWIIRKLTKRIPIKL